MTRKLLLLLPVLSSLLVVSATADDGTQKPGAAKPPAKPASTAKPAAKAPPKKGDWTARGFLSANGIFQVAAPSFTQTQAWTSFAETATATIEYPGKNAPGVDVSGGYRVWRNLAVGAGVAFTSRSTITTVSGSLPNPLYLNRPLSLSGGFNANHSETAINVQATWVVPISPKMLLMVFGGPSFVNVTQTIVEPEGIGVSIVYPYDSGAITAATTSEPSQMAVGFSAGADFSYFFSKTVGVGGMVRYSRATANFPVTGQSPVSVATGGLAVGGGLRVVFPPSKPAKPAPPAKPQPKSGPPAPKK